MKNLVVTPLYRVAQDGPKATSFGTIQKVVALAVRSAKKHILDADEFCYMTDGNVFESHTEMDRHLLQALHKEWCAGANVLYFEGDALCLKDVNMFSWDRLMLFAFAARSKFKKRMPKGQLLNTAVMYVPQSFTGWDTVLNMADDWKPKWGYFQLIWSLAFYEQFANVQEGQDCVRALPAGKYNWSGDYVDLRVSQDKAAIQHFSLSRGPRRTLRQMRDATGVAEGQQGPTPEKETLVSVLLPSRGRIKELGDTLASFKEHTRVLDRVEFLIKFDSDDVASIAGIPTLPKGLRYKFLISDRGQGYADLHLFVNDLANMAKGNWLFLFNDDALIESDGWDDLVADVEPRLIRPEFKGTREICVLKCRDGESKMNLFPIVNRKIVKILGHFAGAAHCDSYIEKVIEMLHCQIYLADLRVRHLRGTVQDETYMESNAAYSWTRPVFKSDAVRAAIAEDAEKLRSWLDRRGRWTPDKP